MSRLARHYPHQRSARYVARRTVTRWCVWSVVVTGLLTAVIAMPETWWAL